MSEEKDEVRLKEILSVFGKEKYKEIIGILERDQRRYYEEQLKLLENTIKELDGGRKLNFGDWKFSKGLRYTLDSDFMYINNDGKLFDVDFVNNSYDKYYDS